VCVCVSVCDVSYIPFQYLHALRACTHTLCHAHALARMHAQTCTHACMYARSRACISNEHAHTHVCSTHARSHARTHSCMQYSRTQSCMHTLIYCACTHAHTRTLVCTHSRMRTRSLTRACARSVMHTRTHSRMHKRTHPSRMRTHARVSR